MNRRIKLILSVLRYFPQNIYFNFHYLPWKQAIKLPILLYKPKLGNCTGNVQISGGVKTGMIKLGFNMVSIYPNSGVVWDNSGTVIFNGLAVLGNDTKLSVAKTGHLFFGNKFTATCGLKLACYNKITFEDDVLVGWDCTVSDTDFHAVYKNGVKTKGYGEIRIGKGTWVSMKCTILKDTVLPSNSVLAAGANISKDYSTEEEKTLFCSIPAIPKAHNIYLNGYDREINYE